jgi:membrane-associated phospholipid phosphatase
LLSERAKPQAAESILVFRVVDWWGVAGSLSFRVLMNWTILIILCSACAVLMLLERLGLPTTLALQFKGDVKRETRWLAQYGQSLCTPIAGLLVFQLDPGSYEVQWHRAVILVGGVLAASIVAMVMKRLIGRVRPGRENAGRFLGPSFKHANFRESFPSSHSACAVALSVFLSIWYPAGASTFWGLALGCAGLRYVLDAHWPSDVLGGVALGYGVAYGIWVMCQRAGWG